MGSAPAYQTRHLHVRINNLLRIILGVQWEDGRPLTRTDAMYESLDVLKLPSLYKFNLFKLLRQLLDGRYPDMFNTLLRPFISTHTYEMRRRMFLHPPLTCEVERRFLTHQMIIMHDTLPRELLDGTLPYCLRSFKLKLLNEQISV